MHHSHLCTHFSRKCKGESDVCRKCDSKFLYFVANFARRSAFDSTGFHVFPRFIPLAILQRLTLASFVPTVDTSCLLRLQAFLRLTPVVCFPALNSCTRTLHRLHVFTRLLPIAIFPRLTQVAYLPALATGFGFHVFPRLVPAS